VDAADRLEIGAEDSSVQLAGVLAQHNFQHAADSTADSNALQRIRLFEAGFFDVGIRTESAHYEFIVARGDSRNRKSPVGCRRYVSRERRQDRTASRGRLKRERDQSKGILIRGAQSFNANAPGNRYTRRYNQCEAIDITAEHVHGNLSCVEW
jgi:hypothetical protein